MMDSQDLTQPTQDPRRLGRNNSGLNEEDVSDVMCILHPCSPAAFGIVASTAEHTPENVLQNNQIDNFDDGLTQKDVQEQETFILDADAPNQPMDLALRLSVRTKNPAYGFMFGRNSDLCDIVLAADSLKRISNMHFSIFLNDSGVLMLMDMSTNGTVVDDVILKGRETTQRMLNPGSIIQILSPKLDDVVKFIVRIPCREGHDEAFRLKWRAQMERAAAAGGQAHLNYLAGRARQLAAPQTRNAGGSIRAPIVQNQFGMHWTGGDKYNVVGLIGKGAFATVYQLATKSEGKLFAAKELEKRKFMKNGVLDRKLDNEMQIMKSVSHRNIVQYVEYQEHHSHMYIIMEFVPCGDLQQYLGSYGALDERLGITMAAQVLKALAYLHANKITHRDIKPDNILLADLERTSFEIKLSDFGLSKVVAEDKQTFLKTFCGTLLYCAPEVFPHYDDHVAGKGKKRARRQQPARFHSYSQSVDVWSFGAVFWFSVCARPPFDGVADKDGRGMFDKIMMTPLDTRDLQREGITRPTIEVMVDMLNTDPAARPSAAACLDYPCFQEVSKDGIPKAENRALRELGPITEDEEWEAEPGAQRFQPDVARLSLHEPDSGQSSQNSEVSIHSGSLEFLDPRQSKRFKSEAYREQDDYIESSPELFHQSIPIMHQPGIRPSTAPQPQVQFQPAVTPRAKLFGEISQTALAGAAFPGYSANDSQRKDSQLPQQRWTDEGYNSSRHPQPEQADGSVASPSLLGAESLVRELNMDSPENCSALSSQGAESNKGDHYHFTPKKNTGTSQTKPSPQNNESPHEITPKQPPRQIFNRQISIPIPASFYYKADDPSTHNLAYASKVSGRDYLSDPSHEYPSDPNTTQNSTTDADEPNNSTHPNAPPTSTKLPDEAPTTHSPPATETHPQQPQETPFLKPPPRLGRLTSTPDSFAPITLNLSTRLASWGRAPYNTHVHADAADTRVPKRGIIILFCAKGLGENGSGDAASVEQGSAGDGNEDRDAWTRHEDLYPVITTESSAGIWVNGVWLRPSEPAKGVQRFGRVYSGDEIVVVKKDGSGKGKGVGDGRGTLKFVCEFFRGEGRARRDEAGTGDFVVETRRGRGAKEVVPPQHQQGEGERGTGVVAVT